MKPLEFGNQYELTCDVVEVDIVGAISRDGEVRQSIACHTYTISCQTATGALIIFRIFVVRAPSNISFSIGTELKRSFFQLGTLHIPVMDVAIRSMLEFQVSRPTVEVANHANLAILCGILVL